MKKLYLRILRDFTAARILSALVASPERYKYIAKKIKSGELDNKTAPEKNVNKSILMAEAFIEAIDNKKTEKQPSDKGGYTPKRPPPPGPPPSKNHKQCCCHKAPGNE